MRIAPVVVRRILQFDIPDIATIDVLLHAFEKHAGAVPRVDKELAKRRMADFRKRMDAEPRRPPRAAGDDPPGGRDRP